MIYDLHCDNCGQLASSREGVTPGTYCPRCGEGGAFRYDTVATPDPRSTR